MNQKPRNPLIESRPNLKNPRMSAPIEIEILVGIRTETANETENATENENENENANANMFGTASGIATGTEITGLNVGMSRTTSVIAITTVDRRIETPATCETCESPVIIVSGNTETHAIDTTHEIETRVITEMAVIRENRAIEMFAISETDVTRETQEMAAANENVRSSLQIQICPAVQTSARIAGQSADRTAVSNSEGNLFLRGPESLSDRRRG